MKKYKGAWLRHYPLRNNRKIGKLTPYQFQIYIYLLEILFEQNCKTVTKCVEKVKNLAVSVRLNEANKDKCKQILAIFESETKVKLMSNSSESEVKTILNWIESGLSKTIFTEFDELAFECRARKNLLKKTLQRLHDLNLIILKNNKIEIPNWFYYQNFRTDDKTTRMDITRTLDSICYITSIPHEIPYNKNKNNKKKNNNIIDNSRREGDDQCPYQKIVSLFNEICGKYGVHTTLQPNDDRKPNIKQRWTHSLKTLEAWKEYFELCMQSKFLRGEVPPTLKFPRPFRITLKFVTKLSNYRQIIEGEYHREN